MFHLQTQVENDDSGLLSDKSALEEQDASTSSVAEVEALHRQPSPHLMQRDDEALASAENENNMNVESESGGAADRPAEASDATAVLTAVEDSEIVIQDVETYTEIVGDEIDLDEKSSVPELSAEVSRDVHEKTSLREHAVLSVCSEMVIDVQDHEFSDEELGDTEKSDTATSEPVVSPLSDKCKFSIQRHRVESKRDVNEQGQKSQHIARVIRLNRNLSPLFTPLSDAAESRTESGVEFDHELAEKTAAICERPGSDPSVQRTKLTTVHRSSDTESVRPKQMKVDSSSKPVQASRKVVAQTPHSQTWNRSGVKTLCVTVRAASSPDSVTEISRKSVPDEYANVERSQKVAAQKSQTQNRSGVRRSAVKVKSTLSPDLATVTSPKSIPDKNTDAERPQNISDSQQSDASPETVQPREQRADSSESDSLSKTQLEILELEMRARAIKAMIRKQEEIERLGAAEKKRRSSVVVMSKKQLSSPQLSVPPQPSSSVRQPSVATPRHSELRSLQSVVGRSIIKRAEFVARHQRRVAAQQVVEQRHLSQPSPVAARRTFRFPQSDLRLRPMRYIVTSQSASPRIIRLPSSARFGVPLPTFSRRQRQRRFELQDGSRHVELHRSFESASSDKSNRGDKRHVLLSSSQRSVRLASSSRPS